MIYHFLNKYKSEIFGAIICLSLGMLSGYIAGSGDDEWYKTITKPSFNPPSFVFGPVWTIIYIMIGIAGSKIMNFGQTESKYKTILLLFISQLILNLIWSPLFFYFNRIDLALYDIFLLWVLIGVILIKIYHNKTIFLLILPYFLWVSFALFLTYNIYLLNIL